MNPLDIWWVWVCLDGSRPIARPLLYRTTYSM